jgi:hypothetical protein
VENNLQNWGPETMNGWDSMMPGYVLASRIAFYPQEKPEAILNEALAACTTPLEYRCVKTKDAFDGYCKPALFDITAALQTGDNQFTILCDRHYLNELGTGGLLGPVVLYREK